MFEYRPGLYYEPFPRRLRFPRSTQPLEYVFIGIRSTHLRWCAVIAVLLPAVGIEPTSRYQRTFLRRTPYTTRLPKYLSNFLRRKPYATRAPKYLSNSISTSVDEWYNHIGQCSLLRCPLLSCLTVNIVVADQKYVRNRTFEP